MNTQISRPSAVSGKQCRGVESNCPDSTATQHSSVFDLHNIRSNSNHAPLSDEGRMSWPRDPKKCGHKLISDKGIIL